MGYVLNTWWDTGQGPKDITDARVASIYKKGNPSKQENYRPISLLCSLYKVMTSIIQKRLEQGIEQEIQPTRYGFRRGRSTINAVHAIRRIMDRAERTGEELNIILLDWEKAFDKITHSSLLKTLRRFAVPETLLRLIENVYLNPQFTVKLHGTESDLFRQHTGIRQGCPLSPYLFLLVMSAIWADIDRPKGKKPKPRKKRHKTRYSFEESLYADDTLLLGP